MLLKGTIPLFRQLQNSGELKKSSFISILVLEAGHLLRIEIARPFYVLYEICDVTFKNRPISAAAPIIFALS
jgi:hypothetical protein